MLLLITEPRCVNDDPPRWESPLGVQIGQETMSRISDPHEVRHRLCRRCEVRHRQNLG